MKKIYPQPGNSTTIARASKGILLKTFLAVLIFCFSVNFCYSQAVFNTFGSGAWSSIGTWNIVSGTDADNIPDADDDVTILDGMTVTVSGGNQQVKNLTLNGTAGTRLIVNGSTLSIFGTLKGPSSNFSNEILQTDGSGLIKFEGGARTLFSTWSLGSTTAAWLWRMEVALDEGAVGTASGVRASYMLFTSGIYSGTELRVDSTFSDGTGVIIIGEDATVRFSTAIGTRLQSFTPSYCRSLTVNGRLESTSQGKIGGQQVIINGALVQRGFTTIVAYPNGIGANEFLYGSNSSVEYSTNVQITMGDEVNRSPDPNPVIDTVVINVGSTFNATQVLVANNDSVFCNHVRFGNFGKWQISSGHITINPGAMIINASEDRYIVTTGGDLTINGIGTTMVEFPTGPSLTEYNPVRITNMGTIDNFTVQALNSRPPCLGPYPLTSVNYQWDIKEGTSGGSTVTLGLGYSDITKRGSMYVPGDSYIIHCDGTSHDYLNGTSETGTGPFFVTGVNFTTFSLFGITSDASILPLSFMEHLDAVIKGNDVNISWSVNCTSTSVIMDLENSVGNTENFKSIYHIEADAARCGQPFHFNHAGAAISDNYYRIKISDIDGSISYSEIKHVSAKTGHLMISIIPNPVVGATAHLQVISHKDATYSIQVTDVQGRLIQQDHFRVIKGMNRVELEISKLNKGIYFVRCFDKGVLLSTDKMVKK